MAMEKVSFPNKKCDLLSSATLPEGTQILHGAHGICLPRKLGHLVRATVGIYIYYNIYIYTYYIYIYIHCLYIIYIYIYTLSLYYIYRYNIYISYILYKYDNIIYNILKFPAPYNEHMGDA